VTANEDSYRIGGESQQSKCLSAMARRGEMSWSTPNCTDGKTGSTTTQGRSLVADIQLHGQAAPASSNTGGSRQGLWAPPGTTQAAMNGQGAPTLEALMRDGVSTNIRNRKWKSGEVDARPKGNGVALASQAMALAQWGTPTARDHKSGRGNNERDYKELTPMVERQQSGKLNPRWVETLMGLPIGWTMPSCSRPVTIAPTSCDSSATESCRPRLSAPSASFFQS
jgi:hypothetical protein